MIPRIRHALDRLRERYGISLVHDEFVEVERRVAAGDGVRTRCLADGSEYWMVKVHGVVVLAVWWPIGLKIATFLPPTASAGNRRNDYGQTRWPKTIQRDDLQARRRRARSGAKRMNP